MSDREIVQFYYDQGFTPLFWPRIGDTKGPHAKNWTELRPTIDEYKEGYRVGIFTGMQVREGRYLVDVDIDWSPGVQIMARFLPETEFVFGRPSKSISHCFYTVPEPFTSFRYEDIDKSCLLEIRGSKGNGETGLQTMVPPSVWSKNGVEEPLVFKQRGAPGHVDLAYLKRQATLGAIGMLFAKHFGHNGFGHEARLAWAGYLLRLGISVEELVKMGEAISVFTNNLEISDVRLVVESTAARTNDPNQKIKGGPALIKIFGTNLGRSILQRIDEWLGREQDFIRKDGNIVKDNQANIRRAIDLCEVELSYHMFSEKYLVKRAGEPTCTMDDAILNNLWLRIDRELHFRPTFQLFEKIVGEVAREHSFHPVRDYLNSLKWDKVPRIDKWLHTYAKAPDTEYHRAVSAIVLIAAVRRIRKPGCKYDEMLVLESEQGLNKSSALRALCPNDEWFSDDLPLNVDAKQIIERTLGKWIIEASDLTGGRKADRDHLKSMLSRQIDGPARMAYAHYPIERSRQFIIIGTTNSALYLADMTGARRFWPVPVQRFDVEGITRDRDQLWAEAAFREAEGETIRLPERLWNAAAEEQENRREMDAWEDMILDAIRNRMTHADGCYRFTTDELWDLLGIEVARRDRTGGARISEIMQRLGFRRSTVRGDDKIVRRGYISSQVTLNFLGGYNGEA